MGLEEKGVTLYRAKSVFGFLLTSHVVQSVDRESVYACPWLNKHICIPLLTLYPSLDNKSSLNVGLVTKSTRLRSWIWTFGKQAEVPPIHFPLFPPPKICFPGEWGSVVVLLSWRTVNQSDTLKVPSMHYGTPLKKYHYYSFGPILSPQTLV